LSESGLREIEYSSFVHPKWMPALSDAHEVGKKITRNPNVRYSALVPNMKGLELALEAGIDGASVFIDRKSTRLNSSHVSISYAYTLSLHDALPILLSESGLREIEYSSFVHPKWMPALSDAHEVGKKITRNPNVRYSALVPNMKGLELALEAGIDGASVF